MNSIGAFLRHEREIRQVSLEELVQITRIPLRMLQRIEDDRFDELPGEVFARSQIMEELWQTEFDGDERACDVHISNLRQKVERDPQKPELVVTVRGVGYKFSGDED